MSSVDERIVKMVFDNSQFTSKITSTINSLTQLNKATDQIANNTNGISSMGQAFEKAEIMSTKAGFHIQDVWLKVASILEYQVAGKIVDAGKKIANAMTFEGISDGFKEYELKMGSVQTIMAGTGASLQEVNKYLEELNTYSDKTIYSFADMTNNIGKFTNAGVKLEDAVGAIKGIANEAARSGANAQEASRAMYNFSQALSAGYVKLIDWKSIENANMATKEFKDTLLEVAVATGTVKKNEEGMYEVLTKNANGATMKETISATKNFNDSLAYQWMTTDVLTKTMNIYATNVEDMTEAEKAAYEESLRQSGMTEEQIKRFEELGTASTKAASEVKTFSMLIDTLKEAIGSGWAQTWEILIGDFNEAKALWTEVSEVLGGFIDSSSDARNELLKQWDALGGRAVIINSIKRAFEALVAVLKPVKEGFREIFPEVTAVNLYNISKAIQRFTARLMPVPETITKIRHVAAGFFSIFDIGLQLIGSFVKAIFPATKGVSSLAGILLDGADSVGKFLIALDKVIKKTGFFDKVFASIGNVIRPVFNLLKTGVKGILELLQALFSGFTSVQSPMKSAGSLFENVTKSMSAGIKNLGDKLSKLSPIFEGIKSLFKGIGQVLGSVFKSIGDTLSGFSASPGTGFASLMTVFSSLLSGGILYKLFNSVKSFSSLGDLIENLSGILEGLQQKIQAETLMNIAKAVAILAGSIVLVAMIDSNKLAGATTAIGAMVAVITGAMAAMMKAVQSFSPTDMKKSFSLFGKQIFGSDVTKMLEMKVTLEAVAKALIAMGAAVLMMSIGLKVVSKAAEGGHLWDSFAVISLMLGELTLVALALGKWGGKSKAGAKGLISMGAALVLIAEAISIVGKVAEKGNLVPAVVAVGLIIAELGAIVILTEKFGQYKLGSMLGLLSLAVSLNLVVLAVKKVSDALGSEGQHMWQALGFCALILAGLVGAAVVMSKFGGLAVLGGAGAILAATSLLIVVQAIKQISDELGKVDNHVWQSLGVIAAALGILAVGLTLMVASLPGAAALLIASAALVVLGGALKILGSLSLPEIGKGLLVLAGALLILAAGLTMMGFAIPGALALVVAAAGLTVLAGALKLLGSMSLKEIVKSLGALALALGGIAVIGSVLSVFSPFILAFSAALLVLGAALLAGGVGITLFATGLQALVAVVPMGVVALNTLATALLNLIPVIAEKLMEALGIIATKIVEYGPQFTQAAVQIIEFILTAIVQSQVKFGEAVLQLILGILNVLTENIPLIAEAGANAMIAYMNAISTQIPRIVDEAYKCAIALINGLADAIENNNGELIAAVDNLMSAVIQAISQWLLEFTPLGLLMPEELKKGVMDGEIRVKDAMDNVLKAVIDTIRGFFDKFKQAAEYVVGGLIEGLKGSAVGKAVSAAAELGNKVIGGLTSKKGLDENSPSLRAWLAGLFVGEGLTGGIEESTPDAVDAATEMGDKSIGALADVTEQGVDDIGDSLGGLGGLFKEAKQEIEDYDDALGEVKHTQDEFSTEAARSEKIMEKNTNTTHKGYMATMEVIEAEQKRQHAKDKETKAVEANTDAQEANTKASGKGTKATKTKASVTEYATGVVEAFTKHYGKLYEVLGDDGPTKVATLAVKNLAEQTYLASLKAKDATEENKKTKVSIDEMVKSFTEMRKKVYDSVKSIFDGDSFFQKFEVKTETSMKSLLENMRSNINGVQDWSNKLVELGNKGVDQGLLKFLAELGPKSNEYVNAFSTATAEEIQEANKLFAQSATLPDSIADSTLASYAKAGLNVVQGFAGGINENTQAALDSVKNLDTTTYNELTGFWEIASPSKKTYRDGMWLIMGLTSGIKNYSYLAHNAAVTLANDITKVIADNLSESKFYEFGKNVAFGLANGMSSDEAVGKVRTAAENLSKIAATVTEKYNLMNSPSKLYKKYGDYIAQGLALGMTGGESYVEQSARMLSEAIANTMSVVESIAGDDLEIHPVISPVLDLSNLRANASSISGLFPGQSMSMASSIGIGSTSSSGSASETVSAMGGQTINFTQNNYSPKALSRYEIYRDTKNQISMMKGVIANG